MKIIKQENKILKCNNCNTEFILEPQDYMTKVHYGVIGYRDMFLPGLKESVRGDYVYCPCCWNQVVI